MGVTQWDCASLKAGNLNSTLSIHTKFKKENNAIRNVRKKIWRVVYKDSNSESGHEYYSEPMDEFTAKDYLKIFGKSKEMKAVRIEKIKK